MAPTKLLVTILPAKKLSAMKLPVKKLLATKLPRWNYRDEISATKLTQRNYQRRKYRDEITEMKLPGRYYHRRNYRDEITAIKLPRRNYQRQNYRDEIPRWNYLDPSILFRILGCSPIKIHWPTPFSSISDHLFFYSYVKLDSILLESHIFHFLSRNDFFFGFWCFKMSILTLKSVQRYWSEICVKIYIFRNKSKKTYFI